MEPVISKEPQLPKVVITKFPTLRAGIAIQFSGQEEDANGNPLSEFYDAELIVPPLNMDSMQELEQPLKSLDAMTPAKALATLCEAIKQALRRNYRGVPDWLIRQSLDVGNMEDISTALMDVNGMRRKEIEAGKARAARAIQDPPTGTPSTPPSSTGPGIPGP